MRVRLKKEAWLMLKHHGKIERAPILMSILIVITVSIGGLWQIVPLFRLETVIEKVEGMRPYTPLELAGQNIYKREGCYNCHSQQVRPLRDEVERYGHYSLAAESMYDHPFQWGSKRTGPDLARVGEKYSDEWHVLHMINPRDVVPESIMPAYPHLAEAPADLDDMGAHLKALRMTGVPYTDEQISNARLDAYAQARADGEAEELLTRYGQKVTVRDFDGNPQMVTELDALIAYLQRLGNLVDTKRYDQEVGGGKVFGGKS
jgi:cytochrome c oxidase cbb3-type subunit II